MNNYHTQIEKQNILSKVAADNHLLQQNLQSIQGTPINNQPNYMQTADKMMYANQYHHQPTTNENGEIELSDSRIDSNQKTKPNIYHGQQNGVYNGNQHNYPQYTNPDSKLQPGSYVPNTYPTNPLVTNQHLPARAEPDFGCKPGLTYHHNRITYNNICPVLNK